MPKENLWIELRVSKSRRELDALVGGVKYLITKIEFPSDVFNLEKGTFIMGPAAGYTSQRG